MFIEKSLLSENILVCHPIVRNHRKGELDFKVGFKILIWHIRSWAFA